MEESLEEKKERLKKEINELKVVSSNLEYGIGITKFGHDDNIKTVHECLKYLNKNENNVHDTQVNLQYTLYSYAGIHCVKFTDNCVVFKFASFGEYKKCDKYAVQIMIEDDKAKLGHWIMPNWLDIHQVLLETPLQNPRNIMCFIRNCKHHIYCYHHRMTHFNNLKDISDTESETYKNIRSSLKRKRRRIRPIKRKQYEKQKSLLDKVTVEDNPILTLENKRKKTEKISGTPSSVNKFETSRNVKSKFKQTQLNFEVSKTKKQTAVSDETDTESERSRSTTQSSASTKKLPVFTSTPSRGKSKESASFKMLTKWNISDIKSNLTPTKSETILTRKKIKSGNLSKGSLKKNSALKKDKAQAHTSTRETTPIKSKIPILVKSPGQINKNKKIPGLREGVLKDRAKNKNARAERKI
ncbi:uncharacterized protein LOC107270759 isoform X4 [Cephus cinctus]|uniref:Uncharacterized protein LOC107270759 isoform X4 n=1 Tax=Cephus cinctus TaxID=211228 RepID=A0AAJ7C4B8_CEPCN|nr:uncharacterized protein LOC107270759 isoform X4 [Cephus cinctus]